MSDINRTFGEMLRVLKGMETILYRIQLHMIPESAASSVIFYQNILGEYKRRQKVFMKADQALDLKVAFKDKLGNDAKVDGLPVWALTDPALGALTVAEDGLSAVFTAAAVGTLKVQCSADADLTDGTRTILGELEVTILGLEAEVVELSGAIKV